MKRYDIRRHRFLRVITKSLTAITVLTLISCQNIFTEKKVSPENTKKAKLIVTASASTVSRAAIDPQLNLSDFSEFKLYASTFDLPADLGSLTPIATGKSLEELNEPAIELDAGIWNFSLTASLNGVSFSGTNTKFEVSPDSVNPISFTLTPDIEGGGLEIKMTFPTEANKVHITLEPAAGGTALFNSDLTASSTAYPITTSGGKNSITFTRDITDSSERIAPGAYNLIYYFYDSDLTEYLNSCEFIVNIAAGITTSKTDLEIENLNEVYNINYDFKYYTYSSSKPLIETITESELLAQNAGLVLPKKYFCRSNIELPLLNNYSPSSDSVMSFAGWFESSDINHLNLTAFPDSDSDLTLSACFTDTVYVSTSNTEAQELTNISGLSSTYPCYNLTSAVSSIKRFNNLKSDSSTDSYVDWKIIIDGQNEGAELKNIVGKSLSLQGKTDSDTDRLESELYDYLSSHSTEISSQAILEIQTGFPVYIKNLKLTRGGRAINLAPVTSPETKSTNLTLQAGTKIELNIGGNNAGAIYVPENTNLTIEDNVIIQNNVSRGMSENPHGHGGAIGVWGGTVNITGGEIKNNTADNAGGAIHIGKGSGGIVNISGGVISGNTAYDNGGAVCIDEGTLNISGGEITQNTAYENGGAIYKADSSTAINMQGNITFYKATAADDKVINDIYLDFGSSPDTVESYITLLNQVYNYEANLLDVAVTLSDSSLSSKSILKDDPDTPDAKFVSGCYDNFEANAPGYEITSDGKWTAKTDTPYTVIHLIQNVDDNDYTEVKDDKQELYGTTNTETSAKAISYDGFVAQTFSQKTINGDGSTIIEIKYDRKTYNLVYDKNAGTENVTNMPATDTSDYRYEAEITITNASPTRIGYNFIGWATSTSESDSDKIYNYGDTKKVYMIPEDLEEDTSLTLYAQWEIVTQDTGINVEFDTDTDTISVTTPTGTNTIFTADSNYSTYSWTVDGTEKSTTSTLDMSTIATVPGVYDIVLSATKVVNGITVTHTWTGQFIKE